jgi:hypothetical protein
MNTDSPINCEHILDTALRLGATKKFFTKR